VYDTVTVRPYIFPNLNRSSAYQCDEDGFSVSAVATNGVPPFTYQIIGSVPSIPQIISAPQASSIFNINNGSTYSLIRLRALDACGNATLGDASILPLASNGIAATYNCLFYPSTMSVDTIMNATYQWWKKDSLDGIDSVFMGAEPAITIPNVLPSDTAYYVCYLNVNQGCIRRTFYYHLNGGCFTILPVNLLEFKGKQESTKNILQWKTTQEQQLARYEIERQTNSGAFVKIGTIQSRGSTLLSNYQFVDEQPARGNLFYRLKMIDTDGSFKYSNIVLLSNKQSGLNYSIFPNPVTDQLFVRFDEGAGTTQQYQLQLLNTTYQMVWQKTHTSVGSNQLQINRPPALPKGMYLLRIVNTVTKEQVTEKLIFL
jgi:Secretion system C-terminal sorting domain